MGQLCTIPGCSKPRHGRVWCEMHYRRWRRNGDPLIGRTFIPHDEQLNYFNFWVDEWTDDCMIWPYRLGPNGYGIISIDGRTRLVHVLACEHYWGPMPRPNMQAAHGPCHTRACWNGRHTSWKTNTENQHDRLRDGTDDRGEKQYGAVLTAEDVLTIRREVEAGVPQAHLARLYGTSTSNIHLIVKRRNWKHI